MLNFMLQILIKKPKIYLDINLIIITSNIKLKIVIKTCTKNNNFTFFNDF